MLRLVTPASAIASARRVVAAPEPGDTLQLRLIAWSVLKSERGQSVRQSVLQPRSDRSSRHHGAIGLQLRGEIA